MWTIDQYCDEAISRNQIKSDRGLGKALKISATIVSAYRTKRAWPSNATMVRLAKLAGKKPEQALIELQIWKETDENAKSVLKKILSKITIILLLLFSTQNNTQAATIVWEQNGSQTLYYGK